MSDIQDRPFKPVVGYRFSPTDEELINHYLKRKINGQIEADYPVVIAEVDIWKCDPWDLPAKSLIQSDDPEWFFFARKERKAPNSQRWSRTTPSGYWKSTGMDKTIKACVPPPMEIGKRKTLVFQRGRAPGQHTCWIMYEYRTVEPDYEQGAFVLCRLFKKLEGITSNADEMGRNSYSLNITMPSPNATLKGEDDFDELIDALTEDYENNAARNPAELWDPSSSLMPHGLQNPAHPNQVEYQDIPAYSNLQFCRMIRRQASFDVGILPDSRDSKSSKASFVKRGRIALKKPPKAVVIPVILCVFFFGIGWFAKTLNSKI